jgi:hypothetical protein
MEIARQLEVDGYAAFEHLSGRAEPAVTGVGRP